MKFRNVGHWNKAEDLSSLLYFAQIAEELLFEYSLDTYKPSATNTSLLCDELISVITDIENGIIGKTNLAHVIKELVASIKKDDVAQKLIKLDLPQVYGKLLNNGANTKDIEDIINILRNQIGLKKYKKECEIVISSLMKEELNFGKLRSVTRNYITSLLNSGYSSEYLYKKVLSFFYDTNNPINSSADIDSLIEELNTPPIEYNVLFRAGKIFSEIEDSCEKLGVKILSEAPYENLSEYSLEIKNSSDVYLFVEGVTSRDPYEAKKTARFAIDVLSTSLNLFHHKENPSYNEVCLVIEAENKVMHKIGKNTNQMHKCSDLKPVLASNKLKEFLSNFSLDEHSFSQFVRSSELHAQALVTDSEENQIINLWIAIESLVPAPRGDIGGVDHIIVSITPYLNISYIDRIFRNFAKDLLNWDRRFASELFVDIEASNLSNKIASLLTLDEYQTKRELLESKFRDFHLLNDRYLHLKKLMSSPKNLYKALEAHTQRLDWQIRRIYRARNMIVHSGKTPPNINTLITNTHDYLDLIMSGIIEQAKDSSGIYSIRESFKYTYLKYEKYNSDLGKKNQSFTKDNLNSIACGTLI